MPQPSTASMAIENPVDPVYLLRDSLFREYQPANEPEKMLVTQVARACVRLQRAYDAETRLFGETDILVLIKTERETFKDISRYTADCERAWRRAMEELTRLQRQRLGPHHLRDLRSPRSRTVTANAAPAPQPPQAAGFPSTRLASSPPSPG